MKILCLIQVPQEYFGGSGTRIATISNCYNIGTTTAEYKIYAAGILGSFWYNDYKSNILNCYYLDSASPRGVGGTKVEYAKKLTREQFLGKETIQSENGQMITLLESLNQFIDNPPEGIQTNGWKKWTLRQDDYPKL